MSTLLFEEYDRLAGLQQGVAKLKLLALEKQTKKNVALATIEVESSDEYLEMRKQESKLKNVEEMVRLSKLQSKLREFGG